MADGNTAPARVRDAPSRPQEVQHHPDAPSKAIKTEAAAGYSKGAQIHDRFTHPTAHPHLTDMKIHGMDGAPGNKPGEHKGKPANPDDPNRTDSAGRKPGDAGYIKKGDDKPGEAGSKSDEKAKLSDMSTHHKDQKANDKNYSLPNLTIVGSDKPGSATGDSKPNDQTSLVMPKNRAEAEALRVNNATSNFANDMRADQAGFYNNLGSTPVSQAHVNELADGVKGANPDTVRKSLQNEMGPSLSVRESQDGSITAYKNHVSEKSNTEPEPSFGLKHNPDGTYTGVAF
jgi:hypothetical protein